MLAAQAVSKVRLEAALGQSLYEEAWQGPRHPYVLLAVWVDYPSSDRWYLSCTDRVLALQPLPRLLVLVLVAASSSVQAQDCPIHQERAVVPESLD